MVSNRFTILLSKIANKYQSIVAQLGLRQLSQSLGQIVGTEYSTVILIGILHKVYSVAHLTLQQHAHRLALAGVLLAFKLPKSITWSTVPSIC